MTGTVLPKESVRYRGVVCRAAEHWWINPRVARLTAKIVSAARRRHRSTLFYICTILILVRRAPGAGKEYADDARGELENRYAACVQAAKKSKPLTSRQEAENWLDQICLCRPTG
jgi:hypothetical protein